MALTIKVFTVIVTAMATEVTAMDMATATVMARDMVIIMAAIMMKNIVAKNQNAENNP